MRARVNGVFTALASLGIMAVSMLSGALGEVLPYRAVALLLAGAGLVGMALIIVRNRKDVEPVYNRKV